MKKFVFPDSLVLIFSIIVLAQILTYVIPAGEYDRVVVERALDEPRQLVLPDSTGILTSEGEVLEDGDRTIILPSGTREFIPGRLVKDGTYHRVDAQPLAWHASLT